MTGPRLYSCDELDGMGARFVEHDGKRYAIVEDDGLFSHFEIGGDGMAYWLGSSKQPQTPWDFLDEVTGIFRNALRPSYH